MRKRKSQKYRKITPPNKRIPYDRGTFTRSERDLYDLIFAFGLGGCWMSNFTISQKLCLCERTIQRARQKLFKSEVIIIARTNPRTWMMWARYHRAVQQCQVLLFPVRQKMDNPYFVLDPKSSGVTNRIPWGDKMSPKSDVITLTGYYNDGVYAEPVNTTPEPALSRDSVSNSASPTGSTGNRLSGNSLEDSPTPTEESTRTKPDQLDAFGMLLFDIHLKKLIALGYDPEKANRLAMVYALARRAKNKASSR